jgi:glycosyltransferase involved in cell wall biosynthesis
VIKEALLSGLPVVSTDVGDVRQWVQLAGASTIAEPSPDHLARAIGDVLRHRRRENPEPFVAAFSSSAIAERMISVLRAVTSARTG